MPPSDDFIAEVSDLDISNRQRRYKVVMLGSCGVGKTSLVSRYTRDSYDPFSDSTIGAAYCTKIIDTPKGEIKLGIWDTAGQERYNALVPPYYRETDIAYVVCDLSDKSSLDKVYYWVRELENSRTDESSRNGNMKIVIIGNKSDVTNDDVDLIIEGYAVNLGLDYFRVSAKTSEGVKEMFESAILGRIIEHDDALRDDIVSVQQTDTSSSSCFGLKINLKFWK